MTAQTAFGHWHWCTAPCAIRGDNCERERTMTMVLVATGAIPLRSGQRIKRQSAQLIDRSIEPVQRRDQTRILAQTPLKRQ